MIIAGKNWAIIPQYPVSTALNIPVELSDKKSASEYFGTWFKQKSTSADVVSWCKERIDHYNRLIQNLSTLMGKAQVEMVQGMDKAQLQAILAQMDTQGE